VAACAKRRTQRFSEAPGAKNGNPHLSSPRFLSNPGMFGIGLPLLLQQTWALQYHYSNR